MLNYYLCMFEYTLIFLVIFGIVTACISGPLLLIDWLVFRVWLGRKTDKYDRFYKLSVKWLIFPFLLPGAMGEKGIAHALWGVVLMFCSPAVINFFITIVVIAFVHCFSEF